MKIITLIFIVLCVKLSFAQNALSYNYHMNLFNAAFVGVDRGFQMGVGYLRYDLDVEDAPYAQMVSISGKLPNNLGLGLSVINKKIFVQKRTRFYLDASYKLVISSKKNLYFGIKTGFLNYTADFTSLKIENNDPLFAENKNQIKFHIGAGIHLTSSNYYLHFFIPNFLLSDLEPAMKKDNKTISKALQQTFQMYFGGGYHFNFTDYFTVTPVFFSKIDGENKDYDLGSIFSYDKMIDLGFTYRMSNSFTASLSFYSDKNWRLGYAYEFLSSDFQVATHEFLFKIRF